MRNKFPLKKILILVTILAVPGFLYYLLQEKGKNRYKPLPIYGPKVLSGTFHKKKGKQIPDTTFHTVPEFTTATQTGKIFQLKKADKRIRIVSFFYTRCSGVCLEINKNLNWLSSEYQDNKILQFISITLDPDHDSKTVLADYAKNQNKKRIFLSADTSIIYPIAREQFFVNAIKTDEIVHSEKLILLDAENRIRGYYDGTSGEEIKKLNDEIKVLITEELRKIKAEF